MKKLTVLFFLIIGITVTAQNAQSSWEMDVMEPCVSTDFDLEKSDSPVLQSFPLLSGAQTVPVTVGFSMVKCYLFNSARCARAMATMSAEDYNMLGKPDFAEFSYYAVRPGIFVKKAKLIPGKFGDIDMETMAYYNHNFGRYHDELFTLTRVCLDNSCQNVEIDVKTDGRYAYQMLNFPIPGTSSTLPVKVGFRKRLKCHSSDVYGTNCEPVVPVVIIEIPSESYQALGRPAVVSYRYYERHKYPKLKAKLVQNDQGGVYFIKTDYQRFADPASHLYYVMNNFCLNKVGCVNTYIKDESYKGEFKEKILNFTVPQNSYENLGGG